MLFITLPATRDTPLSPRSVLIVSKNLKCLAFCSHERTALIRGEGGIFVVFWTGVVMRVSTLLHVIVDTILKVGYGWDRQN